MQPSTTLVSLQWQVLWESVLITKSKASGVNLGQLFSLEKVAKEVRREISLEEPQPC